MKGQGLAPFVAESLADAEAVINLVRRAAVDEGPPGHPLAPELEACVALAVSELGECRVKLYAPVLALRHVRCCPRTGSCVRGAC